MKHFKIASTRGLAITLSLALGIHSVALAEDVVTYIHTDHLGNPIAYTNEQGVVIEREYYLPYGESLIEDSSQTQDAANYTGHIKDSDTGLLYMQARYYDPVLGRFLSTDPVTFSPDQPGYFNRYWYVQASPMANIDPDGREVVPHPKLPATISDAYKNLKKSSPTANDMLTELEGSDTVYTLAEGIKSEFDPATNTISIAQDGGKGLRGKFRISAQLTEDELVSTIDGENKKVSLEEKIGHEGSHALDKDRGNSLTEDSNGNGLEDTEENASKKTNTIRKEMGIESKRDTYKGVPIE